MIPHVIWKNLCEISNVYCLSHTRWVNDTKQRVNIATMEIKNISFRISCWIDLKLVIILNSILSTVYVIKILNRYYRYGFNKYIDVQYMGNNCDWYNHYGCRWMLLLHVVRYYRYGRKWILLFGIFNNY